MKWRWRWFLTVRLIRESHKWAEKVYKLKIFLQIVHSKKCQQNETMFWEAKKWAENGFWLKTTPPHQLISSSVKWLYFVSAFTSINCKKKHFFVPTGWWPASSESLTDCKSIDFQYIWLNPTESWLTFLNVIIFLSLVFC